MIRSERPGDAGEIHAVVQAAFGQEDEADLVDRIRVAGGWQISLVAERDGVIVGHILFTDVTIESGQLVASTAGLAPMAVSPDFQNLGIGGELIRRGLEECREQGQRIVVVLGHPEYYPRFGFQRADTYGIAYVDPVPPEAFMVLALEEGALDNLRGVARYRPEFSNF